MLMYRNGKNSLKIENAKRMSLENNNTTGLMTCASI